EVHDVVVHVLGAEHEVTHQFRIGRNDDTEGIFHRADRRQRVHRGANAAYPAYEGPGIARIAPLEDLFNEADHRARTVGIGHLAVGDIGFDAQVTLYAGD
ncbi:hypothetical protein RZS08_65180, partial [Arthrospira platensis SPKY1]|nr:hypothetical protein [Arthrospira platensis SPKY1]